MLQVLAERDECICGEIVDDLPLAQATVSRHLKKLKEAGLVQGTIDGPRVCYCLDRDALARLRGACDAFFGGLDLPAQPPPGECC
ncbi:MAG: transcriptional regulator [Bacteroidetes bacterium SW_4_67_19]|nr:MAG: transcriptional regulator [Bacteroidetes bacterium SW_4_67_19]